MKRFIGYVRTVFAWAAVGLAGIRIALLVIRLAGAVGTIDAVANAAGFGDIVAPFEDWFDQWVTHPVLDMMRVTSTPTLESN